MTSRWPLAAGAVVAIVAFGLLARIDVDGRPPDPAPPEPRPTGEPTPEPDEDEAAWPPVGDWRPIANSPWGTRRDHTAVWTGDALLVWGGQMVTGPRSDGATYHPATDSWRRIPAAPRQPLEWSDVPGAWTGDELVLWGATDADFLGDPAEAGPRGVAYDPEADTWGTLPDAPLVPRFGHTATWTGGEVVVWGGMDAAPERRGTPLADGAAYDPATDTWRRIPDPPLTPRQGHAATWLPEAGRLVVWGGTARREGEWTPLLDGAAYDPGADAWEAVATPAGVEPAEVSGWRPAVARLGDPERLAVVAPLVLADTNDPIVALYEPDTAGWALVPAGPVGARSGASAGGGSQLAVWGGRGLDADAAGGLLWPSTGGWRVPPADRDPTVGETATWTGSALLTWGGGREGARWDPNPAPGRAMRTERPQEPDEERTVDLPAGHETGWPLALAGAVPRVTVTGGDATLWLESRSGRGWRIRRLLPATSDCAGTGCVHDFDPLPDGLPGPVEVRVHNTGDEPVTLTVAHTPSP